MQFSVYSFCKQNKHGKNENQGFSNYHFKTKEKTIKWQKNQKIFLAI
jgi:hypothetical protein